MSPTQVKYISLGELADHVWSGGPHEWGYRDPVTGEFIEDDWPFHAAEFICQLMEASHPEISPRSK